MGEKRKKTSGGGKKHRTTTEEFADEDDYNDDDDDDDYEPDELNNILGTMMWRRIRTRLETGMYKLNMC